MNEYLVCVLALTTIFVPYSMYRTYLIEITAKFASKYHVYEMEDLPTFIIFMLI